MINILKIILFLLSNLGYFYYIKKKTNIDNYYIPLIAIAFQMIALTILWWTFKHLERSVNHNVFNWNIFLN